MCRAFVKLPRPWGDQSGGARKWAIRDGCQTWFRAGGYHPDGPPGRKGSAGKARGSVGKRRSTGRSKEYAVGSSISPDYDDSFIDDMGSEFANDLGPSTGQPWDPFKNPLPAEYYPAYSDAHSRDHSRDQVAADTKPRMLLGVAQQPTLPRSQYAPHSHTGTHVHSHFTPSQYSSYAYGSMYASGSGSGSNGNGTTNGNGQPTPLSSYSWPGPTSQSTSQSTGHYPQTYEYDTWRQPPTFLDDALGRRGESGTASNSLSDHSRSPAADSYPHALSLPRREDKNVKRETSPLSSVPGTPE